jgi:RNA polymerase sporulation-specific sigma factor
MQEYRKGCVMPYNPKENLTEEELAVLAANGDDESMARLIAAVMPIAKAKASKYSGPRIPDEDLTQEGMLGFLDAVKSFNAKKGVPFKAYAETCINNRILSALRFHNNKNNLALSNAVSIDESGYDPISLSTDPANIFSGKENSEVILSIIENELSEFEKQVIKRHLAGESYSQIASALNRSEKSVDNALQRIRKKIRSQM